jgi:hypothetical protein
MKPISKYLEIGLWCEGLTGSQVRVRNNLETPALNSLFVTVT